LRVASAATKVSQQIAANRSVPDVLESTTEARLAFERLNQKVVRQFPRPADPRTARMDSDYRQGVRTLLRAHRILATGLKAAPGAEASEALRTYVGERRNGGKLMIAVGKQTARLYFRLGGPDRLSGDLQWSEVRARAKPPAPTPD